MVNINLDKKGIQALLRQGVVHVKFIKKNGSERDMNCTLMEKVLKHYYPNFKTIYNDSVNSKELIKVLDTDLGEFRTINLNTIESIDFSTQTVEEVIKPLRRFVSFMIIAEIDNLISDKTVEDMISDFVGCKDSKSGFYGDQYVNIKQVYKAFINEN